MIDNIIQNLIENSLDPAKGTAKGSKSDVEGCLWVHSIVGGLVTLIPVIGLVLAWMCITSLYIFLPRALGETFKDHWILNLFGGIVLTFVVSTIIEIWLIGIGAATVGIGWFFSAFIGFAEIWASACVYLLIRSWFK